MRRRRTTPPRTRPTGDTTDDAASTDATSGSNKGTKDLLNFLIGDGQ